MGYLNHIIRLCVVVIAVVVGFIIVRGFFVPPSFGIHGSYEYGYFRGDSEAEQESLPALFQSTAKCSTCHEAQLTELREGGHATIACETCHGFWQAHNKNTRSTVPRDASTEACMSCHAQVTGRPHTFPQIETLAGHMKDQKLAIDSAAQCVDCHAPHSPE